MSLRRWFVCFLTFLFLFPGETPAATLRGHVISLLGQPTEGAEISVSLRKTVFDQAGKVRMLPLEMSTPAAESKSDSAGRFSMEVPDGFVSVRVKAAGYVEYLNAIVSSARDLRIELESAEPGEIERAILEARREQAQAAARFESENVEANAPEIRAMSAPVAPTDVWVANLATTDASVTYTGYINLDEYISGVVSRELGDSFPYESLKAQAVAARTYALDRLRSRGQANGGQAYNPVYSTKSRVAAHNSSGVALTYNNSYITAFFSARCNGDFTMAAEDGLESLATCRVGGLVGRPVAYLKSVPCSGHVNCSQTTEQCCVVTAAGRTQYIYGHGVGLCQRGAQQFAGTFGMNWDQIVKRFYTDVAVLPGNRIELGDRVVLSATSNRRTTPCGALGASVNAGATGTLIDGPQTVPCALLSGTSYITWWRVGLDNGTRGWIAEDFLRKTPAAQAEPELDLNIWATAGATSVQIAAQSRASVRVVLEGSTNFLAWSAVATNVISTNGLTTFTVAPGATGNRNFRARLLLPDLAP